MRLNRPALAAFALALAAVFAASPAAGQTLLPGIYISTGGSEVGPSVPVEITWVHESYLDADSRSITLQNGQELKGDFSYEPAPLGEVGASTSAVSRYTLQVGYGTHTLTASICGGVGTPQCTTATSTFTYSPPPPRVDRDNPRISLVPHSAHVRDFTADAATASYSAPSYVSMGQPRALTLGYSSELADPRPLIQLDVQDRSQIPADKFSIQVRAAGTAVWLTQSNGQQVAFYTGGGMDSVSRLAVQLPPGSLGTGLHRMEVEVTSHWGTTAVRSASQTVDVLVLDRRQSPYGRGWGVQGLQQAYPGPHGVLIDEGDGSARFFSGSGTYNSPPGDESTLFPVAGDSLVRRYPDGTRAVFGPVVPLSSPQVRPLVYTQTRLGAIVRYAYHADGRLHSVTDPAGKETVLAYLAGPAGTPLLSTITVPGGRQLRVARDSLFTDFFDADNVRGLRQTHTSAGRQTVLYPRTGGAWTTTYSPVGTLAAVYTPTINVNGAPVRVITRYTHPRDRMLPAAGQGTSSAPRPRVRPDSVYTRVLGPRGDVTRVWADRFGLPTRMVDPVLRGVEIQRDAEGRPTRVVEYGDTTLIAYNGDGTVHSTFDKAHEQQVTYTYESLGGDTFLRGTSGSGQQVTYNRGPLGQVQSIVVDGKTVASFTYEADFQVRTATDAGGHATEYFYGGNPWRNADSVRVGMPTSRQTSATTYDAYGRAGTVTDPAGRTTTFTYDALDRITKQRAPGDSVMYLYNVQGLAQVTDAAGKQYQFVRNGLGWVDRESDPLGQRTYYVYDAAGNVISTTDRAGRTFGTMYDLVGRPIRFAAGSDTTWYGYDDPARMTWVRNAESTDTLLSDRAGRPVRHTTVMAGQRYETHSDYDAAGARSAVVTVRGTREAPVWGDSTGFAVVDGQLRTLVYPANTFTHVGYDTDGMVSGVTYPGTLGKLTLGYTPRHQLGSATYSVTALQNAFGTWLDLDDLDRVTYSENSSRHRRYEYDPLGRLSVFRDSVKRLIPPQPGCGHTCFQYEWRLSGEQSFAYDAVGNRTGTLFVDSAEVFTSDVVTTTFKTNRDSVYGIWTMTYDSVGNLVRRTSATQQYRYYWNALGQLRSVVTPAGDSVSYGYNGLGTRVRRTLGSSTIRYLYDGDDLAAEVDGSGNRIRSYVYWPGIDRPYAMRTWEGGQNGALYYYALDAPGSTVQGLFNTAGTITHRYQYTPFGEPLPSNSSAVVNPLRFAGRELDATTGLYYVRARWYDPSRGRFMSEDPIGLAGGINNYAYATNDPVNLSDPTGLCGVSWGGWSDGITITSQYGGCDRAFKEHRDWSYNPNDTGEEGYFGILRFRNISRLEREVEDLNARAKQVRSNAHRDYGGVENSDWRHACGSYVLTQEFGVWPTRLLGVGNEVQGFFRWDIWDLSSRLQGRSPWAFQISDMKVNEVGMAAASLGMQVPQCNSVRTP